MNGSTVMYEEMFQPLTHYPFPELPYKYEELEPYIDTATLKVHHKGHHRTYTNNMNGALEEWREKVESATTWGDVYRS